MNDEVQVMQETAAVVADVATKPGMSTGLKVVIIGGTTALIAAGVGLVFFIKNRKAKKAKAASVEQTESK